MNRAITYLEKTLPEQAVRLASNRPIENVLPIFIHQAYDFAFLDIYEQPVTIVEAKKYTTFNTEQIKKHLEIIADRLRIQPILVLPEVDSVLNRKLVQKDIDFVVPGKQMFLPHLMISLKENRLHAQPRRITKKLLPSAQLILLYHLLNNKENLKELTMKELASKFNYTQMAISKAAANLLEHELCEINGNKEKHIVLAADRQELWNTAQPFLVNPVQKTVFVDALEGVKGLLKCNGSALADYTDLNPTRQKYYAIDKNQYHQLIKNNQLRDVNEYEGLYCLEIWKYDPKKLVNETLYEEGNVDPLSLYLSLKDTIDERIEMGLDHLKNYIWLPD